MDWTAAKHNDAGKLFIMKETQECMV